MSPFFKLIIGNEGLGGTEINKTLITFYKLITFIHINICVRVLDLDKQQDSQIEEAEGLLRYCGLQTNSPHLSQPGKTP
jgi:hypothetical protein